MYLHPNLQWIIVEMSDHDCVQPRESADPGEAQDSLAEDTAVCYQQHSPDSHMTKRPNSLLFPHWL